ncbi:hypothetical protein [Franconibacter helveticus]|uniref:hypothetical protein n=1 Tax=Franconibacter helveticus TaxID=357240 RepID=UPI00290FD741|nr:hypothetical protein [Franconibacter helveticus]MDU6923635.1 hypothetical protein [Franconibacter helveticus]
MTLSKVIESEIADFFADFGGLGLGAPDIQSGQAQLELTERLLSVLALRERAEPVAVVRSLVTIKDGFVRYEKYYVSDLPDGDYEFYTAPPAPVVPDERYQQLSELYHAQEKRLFKLAQRIKGPAFDKYAYSPSQAIDLLEVAIFGENDDTCRAAMLQGKADGTLTNEDTIAAEPVSPAYKLPSGWGAVPDDTRRMDWLVSKTVNVREPLVYGSRDLFWSQTITDEEDEKHATKLREQIDAAMLAAAPAPGKEG